MSSILIEARKNPRLERILGTMAEVCAALGHTVVRWRGPLSGRTSHWRWPWKTDAAILFNGTHPRYARHLARFVRRGTPLVFVEQGWFPQGQTIQVDPRGINADASWVGSPLAAAAHAPLAVRPEGDLLVLLQSDKDTQVTRQSPWFADIHALVRHLLDHSRLPLRLRAHPEWPTDPRVVRMADEQGCRWDRSPSLGAALGGCRAVACLNSSGAVEALAARLPVLCYGLAIYRQPGAVYCLTGEAAETSQVTQSLAEQRCGLNAAQLEAMLERILERQWTVADIATRLPTLLAERLSSGAPLSVLPARATPEKFWRRSA